MEGQFRATIALLTFTILFGTSGYAILHWNNEEISFLDCLYMTVVTISTVGYGEHVPVHNWYGKIFTMILMIFGIGAVTYTISLMTAFLVEGQLSDILRKRRMEKLIAQLEDHYIVCGGGQTGLYVIEELIKMKYPVVIIDRCDEIMKRYEDQPNVFMIVGDATDDDILEHAGLARAKGIVPVLSEDKDNLFITVSARQINPKIRIVAKGVGPKIADKLKRAGANSVVSPNTIGGMRLASELIRPSVVSFLDIMLRKSDKTLRIEEITVRKESKLAEHTVESCPLKKEFGILILAFMDAQGKVEFNPSAQSPIRPGTTLIVMGDAHDIIRARDLGQSPA